MPYAWNPEAYPEWIRASIEAILTGKESNVRMEFDSPREAGNQRSRIYTYLSIVNHDGEISIKQRKEVLLLHKRKPGPIGRVAPPMLETSVPPATLQAQSLGGAPTETRPQAHIGEHEQQMLARLGLKAKVLPIGNVPYFTIEDASLNGDYKYHVTLMEAIRAHLGDGFELKILQSQGEGNATGV